MFDYSFFALLFAVATALAPPDASEVTLRNQRHPRQTVTFTRGDDGRWALRVNDRDVGALERRDGAVFHHTGQRSPGHFPIDEMLDPATLDAARIRLRGRFAPTVLSVRRDDGRVILHDPGGELLRTDLALESR